MLQGFSIPQTTKRQRNHAPAALLRLGALAQRLTVQQSTSWKPKF